MFHRRYARGIWPLLVWADDEDAADIVASIHASVMSPICVPVIWLSADEIRAMYEPVEGGFDFDTDFSEPPEMP